MTVSRGNCNQYPLRKTLFGVLPNLQKQPETDYTIESVGDFKVTFKDEQVKLERYDSIFRKVSEEILSDKVIPIYTEVKQINHLTKLITTRPLEKRRKGLTKQVMTSFKTTLENNKGQGYIRELSVIQIDKPLHFCTVKKTYNTVEVYFLDKHVISFDYKKGTINYLDPTYPYYKEFRKIIREYIKAQNKQEQVNKQENQPEKQQTQSKSSRGTRSTQSTKQDIKIAKPLKLIRFNRKTEKEVINNREKENRTLVINQNEIHQRIQEQNQRNQAKLEPIKRYYLADFTPDQSTLDQPTLEELQSYLKFVTLGNSLTKEDIHIVHNFFKRMVTLGYRYFLGVTPLKALNFTRDARTNSIEPAQNGMTININVDFLKSNRGTVVYHYLELISLNIYKDYTKNFGLEIASSFYTMLDQYIETTKLESIEGKSKSRGTIRKGVFTQLYIGLIYLSTPLHQLTDVRKVVEQNNIILSKGYYKPFLDFLMTTNTKIVTSRKVKDYRLKTIKYMSMYTPIEDIYIYPDNILAKQRLDRIKAETGLTLVAPNILH